VTRIENSAFRDCPGLTNLTVNRYAPGGPNETPSLGKFVFTGSQNIATVSVPAGAGEAYRKATGWSVFGDRIKDPHTHTYSDAWTSDDAYHWHAATCGHGVVADKAPHAWDDGVVTTAATTEAAGVRTFTCTVCGKTKAENIPVLHAHTYSDAWTSDDAYHWHAATCGHGVVKDKAPHAWDDGVCTTCGAVDYSHFLDISSAGSVSANKSTITSFPFDPSDPDPTFAIPASIGGVRVTSIGDGAFRDCKGLKGGVTIPEGVTSIGDSAFLGCDGLTSVTIPNGVTSIGESAFFGCAGLTGVTIPDSVTSIGSDAFAHCTGLTDVTIPNSVTVLGSAAFSGCRGLTGVTIPGSVTRIENWAFMNCKRLKGVTIPNGVTSIGESAFFDCEDLTDVTISGSVTSIEFSAFRDCPGLTNVTVNRYAPGNPDEITSLGADAFAGCPIAAIKVPADAVDAYRKAENWREFKDKIGEQ